MHFSRLYFRIFIFIGILLWCTGFSANLFSGNSQNTAVYSSLLNLVYDNVCHQNEDKLISLSNFHFLVCARCTGIYTGGLLSSAFLLIFLKQIVLSSKILLTVSLALLLDVMANNFIFSSYNKITAFFSGIFFGSVCLIITLNLLEVYLLKPNESI